MEHPPAKIDLSISMEKANIYALALLAPLTIVLIGPFVWLWGGAALADGVKFFTDHPLGFLVLLALGIVVHEALHGLTWMLFGKKGPGAIRFGFQLKTLTPYAHCVEPLEINAYRLGTLAPGLLLGVLPAVWGMVAGSGAWLWFGLLFTLTAGGDFLILWIIRGVRAGVRVEDHPTRAGCYLIEEAT